MKNYFFSTSEAALRVFLSILAFSFLLNANVFPQNSYSQTYVVAKINFIVDLSADEKEIFSLVNDERRQRDLEDLSWDSDLARIARKHSQNMAKGNFFEHEDEDGNHVWHRAKAAGISYKRIAENIFYSSGGQDYTTSAVEGWMDSTGHRRNILSREYTDTGIGIAKSSDGEIYVTQVFLKG